MRRQGGFVRKTRGGGVVKVLREHYLRDDIFCGSKACVLCEGQVASAAPLCATREEQTMSLSASTSGAAELAPVYLVPDTNVFLHQMDFLEDQGVRDVVVLGTCASEVQHRNLGCWNRLKALLASPEKRFYLFSNEHHRDTFCEKKPGESPNDRNDRAVRHGAAWYARHFGSSSVARVILLSGDRGCLQLAEQEHKGLYVASTVHDWVASYRPDLLDKLAAPGTPMPGESSAAEGVRLSAPGAGKLAGRGGGNGGVGHREHLSRERMTEGLGSGTFHRGTLRVNPYNPREAYVSCSTFNDGRDIIVSGFVAQNRAVQGDSVCVQVLPVRFWRTKGEVGDRLADQDRVWEETDNVNEQTRVDEDDLGDDGDESRDVDGELGELDEDFVALDNDNIYQSVPRGGMSSASLSSSAASNSASAPAIGGSGRPTGRIVGILRRAWDARPYAGSLEPPKFDRQSGPNAYADPLFVPVDSKLPKVRVRTRQLDALLGQRILVQIDAWERGKRFPSGHYVKALGKAGDRDVESAVILHEHEVNDGVFSGAVLACVPPLPWTADESQVAGPGAFRTDLRHLEVCSVDPPGCKDIDDALHARPLPNGNIEVGVHIADVAYFVHPGTPIDQEAAERGTSVYLVERRIDMLPEALTTDICSLRCDGDRYAFSVLWEVSPADVSVKDVRFCRSLIRSRASLSYAQAQAMMDDPSNSESLTHSLRTLNALAKKLRASRLQKGALTLASPEVRFDIDTETHNPTDVRQYELKEANSMVEEFMLLANCTVADKICAHFPTHALLRRHPTPQSTQFEPLVAAVGQAGFKVDHSSSKALADSLDRCVQKDNPYFNNLVRILATRCMTQAVYFGSGEVDTPEYSHYGLAASIYTHFTSPIRRYADLVVHRLLAAALGLTPLPRELEDKEALRECTDNLNRRHRNAQFAGRASVDLHTLVFFKLNPCESAEAHVVRVRTNGLVVFVPRYGIEAAVYLGRDVRGFRHDEGKQALVCVSTNEAFAVFDRVSVRISVEEDTVHRRKLNVELLHKVSRQ